MSRHGTTEAAGHPAIARSWWVRLDAQATERLSGRPATDDHRRPRRTLADIRTPAEIDLMAEAGRVAALALRAASAACVPGATTAAVDGAAAGVIAAERCEPAFLGLRASAQAAAFPAATCEDSPRGHGPRARRSSAAWSWRTCRTSITSPACSPVT